MKSLNQQLANYRTLLGEIRQQFGEVRCNREISLNGKWVEVKVYKSEAPMADIKAYIEKQHSQLVSGVRLGEFRHPKPHEGLMFRLPVNH